MYKDMIVITDFVIDALKDKKTSKKRLSYLIYDMYRSLYRLNENARHVLVHYLTKPLESINADTSFGSQSNKWLYFNNKNFEEYDSAKRRYLHSVSALTRMDMSEKFARIIEQNTCCKGIETLSEVGGKYSHIDHNSILHMFHFNFRGCNHPQFGIRDYDLVWQEVTFDLNDEAAKEKMIEEAYEQVKSMASQLSDIEAIMLKRLSLSDLFMDLNALTKRQHEF